MFRESCSPLHQSKDQPDTEFLRIIPFYITLFIGVMERKKRIVGGGGGGGERKGGNRSIFNNRKNDFPYYFIYIVAIISI